MRLSEHHSSVNQKAPEPAPQLTTQLQVSAPQEATLQTQLLRALRSLLQHNPFEHIGNFSFTALDEQPEPTQLDVFVYRHHATSFTAGIDLNQETIFQCHCTSMRSALEKLEAFVEHDVG